MRAASSRLKLAFLITWCVPRCVLTDRRPPMPLLHRRDSQGHAACCPSFSRVLMRPPRCSGQGELTLRSSNLPFRSAEIRATPSGRLRIGSGSGTATTLSSSPRRRVVVDEQRWQSQKNSTRLDLHVRNAGSVSTRKSLPSCRERNGAEQEGLLHLASITAPPLPLCASDRPRCDQCCKCPAPESAHIFVG